MPVTIEELEESREHTEAEDRTEETSGRRYLCTGSESETEVIEAVKLEAPATIARTDTSRPDLVLASVAIRNESISDVWTAQVLYLDDSRVDDRSDVCTVSTAYDTGSQTQKVFEGVPLDGWPKSVQDFGNEQAVPYAKTPDVNGGSSAGIPDAVPNILDMRDGNGLDVPVGTLNFRQRWVFPANAVTLTYMRTVAAMRGRTNQYEFCDQAPGEVLFLGANARQPGGANSPWEVEYVFRISPNQYDVTVYKEQGTGYEITFDFVGGHDYIQFLTRPAHREFSIAGVPGTIKVPVPQVIAAFVHKKHPAGNFSLLGISCTGSALCSSN